MPATHRDRPTLLIDGQPAPTELMEDILQLSVEESLHRPGLFTLVLQNDYYPGRSHTRPWRHQNLLQIGKPIKVGFSTSTTEAPAFNQSNQNYLLEGEITAIETQFSEKSQAPIIVRGYDVSHRLHRGHHNRSFQNMTDSDIVKKIVAEVGIKEGAIEDSGIPHDYVFQENQSNMAFLRERAMRLGFELFVQDGKLNFRKPKVDGELRLKWLTDLHSFRVRVTSAEQVKAVEVRAWDYGEKRAIVSTRQREQVLTTTQNGHGSDTSPQFNGRPNNPTTILVDQPVFSSKEADVMAQAACDELGGQFVCADARGEGNATIRPGRVVQLDDMGPHSGQYYVTETRHIYQERVYRTEFSVRGLRGGYIPRLTPQPSLQPGQTLLVGIVTDNEDPEGWGRVKVKFPTLTEEHASNWARVVAIGAGNACGFDCLPEINDEVLVAFEHGDIHRPYILGGVWNGTDAPPVPVRQSVQNGRVRVRTFKTRAGHQLQFVDDEGGKIQIQTAGGQTITLNDSDGSIQISATASVAIAAPKISLRGALVTTTTPIQVVPG
ncbi:VgrG-related protein [Leptolyngbya sp. FACHB-8]|uniref:VgrG-related protein n=1 Tax=unclassified Leptolyngbya TaxID=2650499 RepID=UPI001688F3CB|nr:VgrG-related protein [Leptolyngbya sp. FACHB-8]MBD1909758.1 VgrG-related protein [Leptolyngbya sp. FACHB-8]